jgi:hypothetical protein
MNTSKNTAKYILEKNTFNLIIQLSYTESLFEFIKSFNRTKKAIIRYSKKGEPKVKKEL